LAYNAVTTENFQAVCEDVSGLDLNAFFQQWIYGERYPQYSVSWEILDSDELIVTINQTQSWQLFHMPIDLQILTGLDTLNVTVENQNQTQEYNLGIVSQPLFNVILDPDDWILKSVEYLTLSNQVPGPDQITLFPAFPNPFNPETSISFFIPEKVGEIKSIIQIYDIKGRLVDEIHSGRSLPGMNHINWNASGMASGTYFVQLNVEEHHFKQKIQLVK